MSSSPSAVETGLMVNPPKRVARRKHRCLINSAFIAIGTLLVTTILGLLSVLTGHVILRATIPDSYNFPLYTSVQVGATGAIVTSPAIAWIFFLVEALLPGGKYGMLALRKPRREPLGMVMRKVGLKKVLELFQAAALGAAAGGVGSTILRLHGHEVMDPVHAARAGTLGGAVIWPAALLVGLAIMNLLSALPYDFPYWGERRSEIM
ncbi:hypothetical protein M408DRAFT_329400, partial [Serendipita vermifera MAFF 305830]